MSKNKQIMTLCLFFALLFTFIPATFSEKNSSATYNEFYITYDISEFSDLDVKIDLIIQAKVSSLELDRASLPKAVYYFQQDSFSGVVWIGQYSPEWVCISETPHHYLWEYKVTRNPSWSSRQFLFRTPGEKLTISLVFGINATFTSFDTSSYKIGANFISELHVKHISSDEVHENARQIFQDYTDYYEAEIVIKRSEDSFWAVSFWFLGFPLLLLFTMPFLSKKLVRNKDITNLIRINVGALFFVPTLAILYRTNFAPPWITFIDYLIWFVGVLSLLLIGYGIGRTSA